MKRRPLFAIVGIGAIAALALSGCSRADNAAEGGGDGVPVGSDAAAYQEALADMEPVTLIYQTLASSADSPDGLPVLEFVERVKEYSGGKIDFELSYNNGIVPNPVEIDKALADGRLDLANFWPQYNPSEYPASGALLATTVERDGALIPGYYSSMASYEEVGLNTPEVVEEYTSRGLTPLSIMSVDGPTVLACREPVRSLADLAGKQVRAGGTVQARQVQELGAIPVSLTFPEIYEALQRGIIDCVLSTHSWFQEGGHLEVAPWVSHPAGASFGGTPTNFFAGVNFTKLPLAAQQLILESTEVLRGDNISVGLDRIAIDAAKLAEDNGGGYIEFDADFDERLAEINEGILAEVEASPALDGEALLTRVADANKKWNAIVKELGYEDGGPVSEIVDWYDGTDPEPWSTRVIEELVPGQVAQ